MLQELFEKLLLKFQCFYFKHVALGHHWKVVWLCCGCSLTTEQRCLIVFELKSKSGLKSLTLSVKSSLKLLSSTPGPSPGNDACELRRKWDLAQQTLFLHKRKDCSWVPNLKSEVFWGQVSSLNSPHMRLKGQFRQFSSRVPSAWIACGKERWVKARGYPDPRLTLTPNYCNELSRYFAQKIRLYGRFSNICTCPGHCRSISVSCG